MQTQGKIDEIATNIQNLTLQLNEFKLESEEEPWRVKGEVFMEIAIKLSKTEEKVSQLTEDLAR